MYKPRIISYDPAKGMITVAVNSGYVTAGTFKLYITDGDDTTMIGAGNFDDNVKDIFLIPVQPDDLVDWTLMIIADYAPAAGHTQIMVDYDFYQQAAKFDNEPVRQEDASALSTHHDFTFEKMVAL